MLIKNFQVGQLETNCYIVTDETSLDCAVIDPGADSAVILDYLESNHLKTAAIFLTHGHFDHTLAAAAVREATGAPIYIHAKDVQQTDAYDPYKLKSLCSAENYCEGDRISVGKLVFDVLETPGHSPGSVTLRCENALFTGDTLFRDSCGRPDLPGGNMETILSSLRRLSSLSGDFEVYPGHSDVTTLDRERSFNYYMKYANENA